MEVHHFPAQHVSELGQHLFVQGVIFEADFGLYFAVVDMHRPKLTETLCCVKCLPCLPEKQKDESLTMFSCTAIIC